MEAKFGKAQNGKVVHIVETDPDGMNVARCDHKTQSVPDESLTVASVTCSKCSKYADFKVALKDAKKPKPKAKAKPPAKKKVAKKKAAPAKKADPLELILGKLENMGKEIKRLDTRITQATRKADPLPDKQEDNRPIKEEDFNGLLKASLQPEEEVVVDGKQFVAEEYAGDEWRIVHIPTAKVMFTKVHPKAVKTCVKYLNNLKVRWEKKSQKIPKDFVPASVAAFKAAYNSHGMTVDMKQSGEARPPRVIKRREKPAERTIRRRDKVGPKNSGVNEYGFRIDTARMVLSELLKKGAYLADIEETMEEHFQFTARDTMAKLKGVIRKLVKTEHPVMYVQQYDKSNDFYQIVQNVDG